MTHIDVVMCSGFSPSARVLRAALRNIASKKDIRVISVAPVAAGLSKFVEEMKSLNPVTTVAVDGCEGCWGLQVTMAAGIMPSKTVILDKYFLVDEKSIKGAEEKLLRALQEMGA